MKDLLALLAVCVVIFVVGYVLFTNATNEERSHHVLSAQGYTDIEFTGYRFFGCGDNDFSKTGFTAKGPTGIDVEGVVCCGLWSKSCTVRID